MTRKDRTTFRQFNAYLGCEVPKSFFLRFQAMCEIRGGDKRIILSSALEEDINRWEKKLDDKTLIAYQALIEVKARQNGFYVKDLVAPLEIKRLPKGQKKLAVGKGPTWPKVKKAP